MFEYQPSRHPLQTFQFWFAILICAGGVAIWRFGGFQDSSNETVEQSPNEDSYSEELPPPPIADLDLGENFEFTGITPAPVQNAEEPAPVTQNPTTNSNIELVDSFDFADADIEAKPFPQLMNSTEIQSQAQPTQGDEFTTNSGSIQQLSSNTPTSSDPLKTAHLDLPQFNQDEPPPVQLTSRVDLAEIDQLIATGDDVLALRKLSTIYWKSPEERPLIRSRLNELSRRIYFQPHPHYMDPHEVQFGERLELIAKKYQVPWQYLAKLNRVDAQRLRAGKKLKVIQGPFHVVVDLSKFEATVHAHGYYVVRMPVGIGKDGATPVGTFKVTDKVEDPIYYGPDGVIKNDDPTNPLGEHWIAISDEANTLQGYGLHGTIDPDSIGKSESRGCVRFHDQDIEDLYHLLSIGSEVIIRR